MLRSTLTLAAMLSVASVSFASDLVTASLFVSQSSTAECNLVNITSAPITVQIQMLEAAGVSLLNSGPLLVPGGAVVSFLATNPIANVYCRFMASKSKVRASLNAFATGTGDGSDNIVVEAH
jgi:hypothetical protein